MFNVVNDGLNLQRKLALKLPCGVIGFEFGLSFKLAMYLLVWFGSWGLYTGLPLVCYCVMYVMGDNSLICYSKGVNCHYHWGGKWLVL